MEKEKLIDLLEKRYVSKRELISHIPLGVQEDDIWQELMGRRTAKRIMLPLTNYAGAPYWYVITDKMAAASEKIIEVMHENETDIDPYTGFNSAFPLEEVFYTSYVEGSRITMQDAMEFLTEGTPPRDIEEQMIANNRQTGCYAGRNIYRAIDPEFLKELIIMLTDGMDEGGDRYRTLEPADMISVDNEKFVFPYTVEEHINELCAFLSSANTHPLIKAAVAQAWTMTVRPFPEGNDRLGRTLSYIILLRAGYGYFGSVSLSALIARKSYGYYNAAANILREENGGDLTYFLEYFMDLLARGAEEYRLRLVKRGQQIIQEEINMAKEPLAVSSRQYPVMDNSNEVTDGNDAITFLQTNALKYDGATAQLFNKMCDRIREGQKYFTVSELSEELDMPSRCLCGGIRIMKDNGIICRENSSGKKHLYRICANTFVKEDNITHKRINEETEAGYDCMTETEVTGEDNTTSGSLYSSSMQERIDELKNSYSAKDRRIADILTDCKEKGEVIYDDYIQRGEQTKWNSDMVFASQMGLVERITSKQYRILNEPNTSNLVLSKGQEKFVKEIYKSFGNKMFSHEMILAKLDYSSSRASTYLHQFTILRIVDCDKGDTYMYRLLINPKEHPEYFYNAA